MPDSRFASLEAFLKTGREAVAPGPVSLILAEDDIEVDSTIRHHLDLGFGTVAVFADPAISITDDLAARVLRVDCALSATGALSRIVDGAIEMLPGRWIHYGYNAEYLFYPFCEHRTVGELTTFATEERRSSVLTYVVDAYAGDLDAHPSAVKLDDAHLDRTGYYALARTDRWGNPLERQLDFFGGLRWRFEEHVQKQRRRIDRVSLFQAKPGLTLRADHTFDDPEYNTYACPWHNSITAACVSFRTAKALKRNPGSTYDIPTFRWHNSAPFEWHSQQLLDLGLMEPGQWF